MKKRRISRQQAQRVSKLQQRRLQRAQQQKTTGTSDQLGPEQGGLLITRFGNEADVEDKHSTLYRCKLRQNLEMLVAGDQVIWQQTGELSGVIVACHKRHSVIGRPDNQGNIKPIAANVDQMLIVTAPQPELTITLLDSYLVVAETLQLQPIISLNKIDLLKSTEENLIEQQLSIYQKLGYPLLRFSCKQQQGIRQLVQHLQDKTSIIVGQSGVGKSSLIASLLPEQTIRIGGLSGIEQGKHTTTTATLYHLPGGGDLIDSPGIREFGLWHMQADDIARGFVEFQPYLGRCKFRNCQHQREPECALRQAVAAGEISAQRLASFHKLLGL